MIHNIRFRLFIYENENEKELSEALFKIFPVAEVEYEEAEGLFNNEIIILSGFIKKKRHLKDFFNRLCQIDKNQLEKLVQDLDRKMDDKGNLFLRLDKEDAINDKWTIIDSGDSIHIKIKIAAYPCKKDIAINLVKDAINI